MPGIGTRAVDALRAAGVAHTLHEYALPERAGRGRDARPSYGPDSAAALGVEPERLLKTLVALVDGSPVLAMVPVAAELDLGALAAAVRGRRAEMADRVQAEKLTGYLVGGISPLGCRRPLPLVVDESALLHETILLSAGRRGLQVELAASDLVRITGAQLARIARPHSGQPSHLPGSRTLAFRE